MANDKFNQNSLILSPHDLFNIKPALLKTKNIKTPCCVCFAFKNPVLKQGCESSNNDYIDNININQHESDYELLTCINCSFSCHRSCLHFPDSKSSTGANWICSFCEKNGKFNEKCAVCPVQWGPLVSFSEKIHFHPTWFFLVISFFF